MSNAQYTLMPNQTAVAVPYDATVTLQIQQQEAKNKRNRKICSSFLCCGMLFFLLMFFLIPRTPKITWTTIQASPNMTTATLMSAGFEFNNYNFYDTTFSDLEFTVVTTPQFLIVGTGNLEGPFTVGARSSQSIQVPISLAAGAMTVITDCVRGAIQILLLTDTSVHAESNSVSHDFGTQYISSPGIRLQCY